MTIHCPPWCVRRSEHQDDLRVYDGIVPHQSAKHRGAGWSVQFAIAAFPEGEPNGSYGRREDIGITLEVDDFLQADAALELATVLSAVVDVANEGPPCHDASLAGDQRVIVGVGLMGFDVQYEQWMTSTDWSPRTRAQRLNRARHLLARWPDPTVVSGNDLAVYFSEFADLKATSRQTYFKDTQAFFRWLLAAGLADTDPFSSDLVRRPRTGAGVPKPLSADEETRALAHSSGRVRAFLLLALRAGLRASEIASLCGEEIAKDYIVLTGKGGKEAAIPTHPELWELAQKFPRRGYWFPDDEHGHIRGATVTHVVSKHFRRPEVDILSGGIHRCRHSYGTTLLRNGANLRQVQTLMRHSSLTTTAIYTAVDESELIDAIGTLGQAEAEQAF